MNRLKAALAALALLLLIGQPALAQGINTGDPVADQKLKEAAAGKKLSDEERLLVLEAVWMWGDAAAPSRDLLADDDACAKTIAASPQAKQAQPFKRMAMHFKCMEDKGWKKREGKK